MVRVRVDKAAHDDYQDGGERNGPLEKVEQQRPPTAAFRGGTGSHSVSANRRGAL